MRKLVLLTLLSCSAAYAQETGSTQAAPSSSASASTTATTGDAIQDSAQKTSEDQKQQDQKSKKDQEKQERKDKKAKKDKKDSGQDVNDTSAVFNERIANKVLGMIRDGLEGHSRRMMLSAFDSDKMDGYLSFEEQIDAFFDHYEAFRVHFRIANVAVEGNRGVVLVDAEMEESPAGAGTPPVRKRSQLRFELEMGRKGWRVVDVRDRSFFS